MTGIRFYADSGADVLPRRWTVKDIAKLADEGYKHNCIALLTGSEHTSPDYRSQEALVATFYHEDSDVSLGAVSFDYLRKCKRIPEAVARKLHPRLFARLGVD